MNSEGIEREELPALNRDELTRLLDPHLASKIVLPGSCRVKRVDLRILLRVSRLDIIAKLIYARAYFTGIRRGWPLELHREHVSALCNFIKQDHSEKNSFERFINAFHKTLDGVKADGFRDEISIIPVGLRGQIMDGAHRVAAAIAADSSLTIFELNYREYEYSANFFSRKGLGL